LSQNLLSKILEAIPPHTSHDIIPKKLQAVFDAFDARILSNFTGNFRYTLKVPIESIRQKLIAKKLCKDNIRDMKGLCCISQTQETAGLVSNVSPSSIVG
jgi:hypothetical protein